MSAPHISVIGGGLAGCAAALAAEARGVPVTVYEQRPATSPPAHETALAGELTGSADLGVQDTDRAGGLLKAELRTTCPAIIECAEETRIGDRTLLVDRHAFAQALTARLSQSSSIDLKREQVRALPDGPVVIASGPGTWSPLARAIHRAAGADFHFSFIGRAPLVDAESVDLSEARWEEPYPGAEPALFLSVTEDEAAELLRRLKTADRSEPPGFDEGIVLADESDTAERLASSEDGGFRRVLRGPRGADSEIDAPALCLTPDTEDRSAFHIEGLHTSLAPEDQRDALRAIGALAEVRLLRAGMVHRTPWLAGPDATLASLQLRRASRMLLAGALTGVYGYAEALALGAAAGIGASRFARGSEPLPPPQECLTGALCRALSDHEPHADGRMLRANFGMIPDHRQDTGLDKSERRARQVARALEAVARYAGAE